MKITALIPRDKLVQISVYRSGGQTSGAGGVPVELTPLVNSEVWAVVEKLEVGQSIRAFGLTSRARWRVKVGSNEDVADNDLIKVTSGHYLDQLIEIEGVRGPDGMLRILRCKDTDRVVKLS